MNRLRIFLIFLLLFSVGAAQNAVPFEEKSSKEAADALRPIRLETTGIVYRQEEGTYLKAPRGVFVDRSTGEVYVADTKNDLIAVYDRDGLHLFSFGYNGEFKEPLKAVTDLQGRIYVLVGIPRKIKIFNYRGDYLQDFPFKGLEEEVVPTALAVDGEGEIYIADAGSGQILVYDSEYRLIMSIGAKGNGDGHFRSVQGIAVDPQGNIYVADARSRPVQVFGSEGEFLRGWGEHATGPQNFSLPSGLALDSEGRVMVVDTLRHAIVVFTKEGRFLGRHGGKGMGPGAVTYPSDIATGPDGRVYVVERVGSRLQIMKERLVSAGRSVGERRKAPGLLKDKVKRDIADFLKKMR